MDRKSAVAVVCRPVLYGGFWLWIWLLAGVGWIGKGILGILVFLLLEQHPEIIKILKEEEPSENQAKTSGAMPAKVG